MNETKWCPGCKQHVDLGNWHRHSRTNDGLQYRCKDCQRALVANGRARKRTAEQRAIRRMIKEQRDLYMAYVQDELEKQP